MFSYLFWRATFERAVKSFAQSLLAVLSIGGLGLLKVEWLTALSTAGMAMLLSVLTSIASERVGPQGDPSVVVTPTVQRPSIQRVPAHRASAAA